MIRNYIITVLLLAAPISSLSQLRSAYDYYPLSVGNEWIYHVLQPDPYLNRRVVSDTLLGDSLRVYKVVEDTGLRYYHYNEDSTVVYSSDGMPRSVNSGFAILDTRQGLGAKWEIRYDGITRAFAIKDTMWWNYCGQYRNVIQVYEVDADKDSVVYVEPFGIYAEGIGLIQIWEESLAYSKINGVECGERPTRIEENEPLRIPKDFQLYLYPNPVRQSAVLSINSPVRDKVEVSIVDILGRTVREFTINPTSTRFQLVWDGRDKNGHILPNGTYFAVVRSGDLSKAVKFVYLKGQSH